MTDSAPAVRTRPDPADPVHASAGVTAGTRDDLTRVAAVADNVVELMRSFGRAKARMMASTEHDVEWSARMILRCLKHVGPIRAGAIADHLQTDPSTVSRQVASLVKDGFLERRADPEDGRASLLVLTGAAEQVLLEHEHVRLEYFSTVLQDWSESDLTAFAAHLDRFTQDYEAANERWITHRFATGPEPKEEH